MFKLLDGRDDLRVEKKLEAIGLPQSLRDEFMSLLTAVHSLCCDTDPTKLSNLLGISTQDIGSVIDEGTRLGEQIYSYLVRWIGMSGEDLKSNTHSYPHEFNNGIIFVGV